MLYLDDPMSGARAEFFPTSGDTGAIMTRFALLSFVRCDPGPAEPMLRI
jgi:hypothetical protein